MSGHSKWATTKHQKAATDAKRGAAFTKLANLITIAAREGGGDPNANFKLRMAIDKAREFSMPKENIERAVKRGLGELEGAQLTTATYEGFGPGGAALMIGVLTDNTNRALGTIKTILGKNGGNIGSAGSVSWQFKKMAVVYCPATKLTDDQELALIDSGAEEITDDHDSLVIMGPLENLQTLKEKAEGLGLTVKDAALEWVPKEKVTLDEAAANQLRSLLELLDEQDEVQEIYTNAYI